MDESFLLLFFKKEDLLFLYFLKPTRAVSFF